MPAGGYFNLICAILFTVIYMQIAVIFTPFFMIIFSFINSFEILKQDKDFFDKFGSLFYEFKNDGGFWSTQYYFVFFLRRFGFLYSQVYLNTSPYWQGSLNIIGSIVQTAFLLYYKPYKDTSMLLSTLIGESTTMLAVLFCFSFMFITSLKVASIIEEVVTYIIILGIGFQMIISFYTMAKSLYLIWNKIKEIRKRKLIKKSESTRKQGFVED